MYRWIYPKVNGDSPALWLQTPFLRVALIDVACVYLFTMPLNLWMQCYMTSERVPSRRAEPGRKRGPAWFDLCYAMQSNRETARIKGLGWNSLAGWRLWFCIGVRRAPGWISCISHTGSCPPCHKNNKHAAKKQKKKERGERFRHTAENRMYFSDNNVEPIEDARWWTFIPALPHLWWRAIPSGDNQRDSSGSDSLFHLIPIRRALCHKPSKRTPYL